MPYPVTNGVTTFLPPPEGYVVDFDNPQKQDAIEHYLVFAILGPIAFLFLVQRLYTKYFILGSWKIDDALIVIAWGCFIKICSLVMQSVQMWSISIGGLCHHAWEMPIEVFEKHMLSSYIAAPVFIICNGCSKTSLLTFYLQISPQLWFRRVIYGTITFVVLYTLIISTLLLFGCNPIQTAWDPFRFAGGKCADNAVVYIIIAVVNIISDLILFVIHIPMIAQLKMPLGQKIGVAIMFGITTITVATSIIRMIYLPALLGALDIPWVAAPANVWSIAEANLFIVCGSMPTLRKFFKRFAPKWFGSSPTPEEAVVVGSVSDQSSRFGLDKKKKKKHTGYSQFETMELGNYPDTVSQETQVIAGKADEENLGNVLYNSSEEAILQQSKIAYTKSFEVSRSP
ncbi:hypothetical protein FAUST_2889 [Fusarium austroamericanum]|uniref:Rhodopsin domain-containing protein n=1 Tax=Fusarium austroamericanum TaxID=282268 RepID=A0AAN6C5V7_FUSAU|nr:hypothetical protein FAUST_2889 [Fusarium austroamericanum]